MKIDFKLLNQSLQLSVKALSVSLFSILYLVLIVIFRQLPFLLLWLLFSFGWIGVKVAIVRDIANTGKPKWSEVGKYFVKYFVRFLPLVLVYIGIFAIAVVIMVVWIATHHKLHPGITFEFLRLYYLDYRVWLPWMVTLCWIMPFVMSFSTIVVMKDISFLKGVGETIKFLKTHKNIYFTLVGIFISSFLFERIIYMFPGATFNMSFSGFDYWCRVIVLNFVNLVYISLLVISLNKKFSS